MTPRFRALARAGALLLMLVSTDAFAQSVSCAGVAEWNPATIYNPGQRLVYQRNLYEAAVPIWNAPPDHCPSCNWYRLVGSCGGAGGGTPPVVSITSPVSGASFACG